ncbi:hypothetical protein WICMUC_004866 [Wickerhamomyces mucosus]|uniref:tRNA-binding domain-containing protein n=1 Tax=Wickerhamomyces mucosus TaxID=1378264 RepID=A0A9P8PEC5_9ASCO|nr:hypothetical protein WICMUC_004866 [Wickerhamomyces mucosus]
MADLISSFQRLSLADAEKVDASKFPELSPEQKALESQWLTLSKRFPESIEQLNENLKAQTYLLGNAPSSSDVVVFARVLPLALKWSSSDYASKRHILRWLDLLQNTLVEVPQEAKLTIDFSIAVPREIKEKPKKTQKDAGKESGKASEPKAKEDKKAGKADKADKPKGKPDEETLKKLREEAAKAKKEKKAKQAAEQANKAAEEAKPLSPSVIDFRVGFIEKAIKHPDADSLYVSTIHCGDDEGPRTVCSGLVAHFPIEALQQRYVVVVANLKPVNMRGIKSSAMVLCGSDDSHGKVEFVEPPAGSKAGDKVFFAGHDGTPEKVLNPKKKVWEQIQPNFSTNETLEVIYKEEGKPAANLTNAKGEIFKVASIVNANVR